MAKTRSLPVTSPRPRPALGRRHAVQALLTGAAAGLAVPGLAQEHPMGEHARHPGRIAEAQDRAGEGARAPQFLGDHALGMTESLGERIVPGAAGAGCALFIDRLLAVGTREDRQRFLTALGAIDGASREAFGVPWSGLPEGQQIELLTRLSSGEPGRGEASWTPGTSVAEYLARVGEEEPPVTLRDHFDYLKGWVMGAYYTSEVGLRELGYEGPVFADSFPGCPHPDGHE